MAIIDDLIREIKHKSPNINVIQGLIKQVSDINTKDDNDYTALIWAASKGHIDVVRLLLEKGADVNLQNSLGYTALHWAAADGRQDIVELLLKQQGIDVNLQNSLGYTALHWAALMGHTEVVQLLLAQQGIEVNLKNNSGNTALDLANNAIKDLLKSHTPANGEFKDLYLTYKHSDKYVLSKLKVIHSSEENKGAFKDALLTSLEDDSFALYRLYNIDFGTEGNLKSWIQGALEAQYNKLSFIECFVYFIRHFIAEYVIYPIWGENEQIASASGSEHGPALVGDSSAATSEGALNT